MRVSWLVIASSFSGLLLARPASALDPGVGCAAAELVAGGRRANALLLCHAVAARGDTAVDPLCVGRAADGFMAAVARAEARAQARGGACPAGGDAVAVEADIDGRVATVAAALRPAAIDSGCAERRLRGAAKAAAHLLAAMAAELRGRDAERASEISARLARVFASVEKAEGCEGSPDADAILAMLRLPLCRVVPTVCVAPDFCTLSVCDPTGASADGNGCAAEPVQCRQPRDEICYPSYGCLCINDRDPNSGLCYYSVPCCMCDVDIDGIIDACWIPRYDGDCGDADHRCLNGPTLPGGVCPNSGYHDTCSPFVLPTPAP